MALLQKTDGGFNASMTGAVTGHEFLKKLKAQGIRRHDSFETFFEYLDRKARKMGIPLLGQFELTPLCNFDCRMCYTHLTKEQMQDRALLTVDQWKRIVDEAYAEGMMRVNLTGGECLTYPGFEELYLYLHGKGCEIRVLTNGSLLNERWLRFFKAHPPILIQISLYGGDEDTYERVTSQRKYAAVSENIRMAVKEGLPVGLALTPSKYMGEGLLDTMRAVHAMGLPYSMSQELIDPKKETGRSGQDHDLSLDDYVELFRLRNELEGIENLSIDSKKLPLPGGPYHECIESGLNCGGGRSCFDVDWDGTMHICNTYRDVSAFPLREGFKASWEKLHQIAAGWPRVPECIECPYEPVCTNCEVKKARIGGSGKQPFALCERTRYLVQNGVYRITECELK